MRQQWLAPSPHPPRILTVSALQMKPSLISALQASQTPSLLDMAKGACLVLEWNWQVKVGPLSVSPIGFGTWTWAWGNQLLWGYDQARDSELQGTFNLAIENRINLCDMTDSYGTGRLIGQSEKLLGKFIREFPRVYDLMSTRVLLSHYSVGTPDVVAINWCVCKGTIPIPQVKKLKQDEENLVVLGWRLSSDELLQLEYVARESPLRMTQNIFQTR